MPRVSCWSPKLSLRLLQRIVRLKLQEYETLCEKLKEMSTLGGISGLLGWGGHAVTCVSLLVQQPEFRPAQYPHSLRLFHVCLQTSGF